MARGLMRWPAVVGAACLAVMVTLYRTAPAAPSLRPREETWQRRMVVSDSIRLLSRSIDSLELRSGEAHRLMSVGRRSPGFSVVDQADSLRSRALPDPIGRMFDSAWASQPARDPSISVLVRVDDRWVLMRTIHPVALDGATCVGGGWSYYGKITVEDAERFLGACGFYGAFGRPGPAIERWFSTSAIGFHTDPPAWRPAPDTTDWYQRQTAAWADGGWALRLARAGTPTPYEFSVTLASCAGGRAGACADAALSPIPAPRPGEYYYFAPVADIGTLTTVLLPDLIHDFGPDRFRTFWKSPEAVRLAFERAFGVSLDDWVRGEVVAYYGPLQLGAGDVGRAGISALIWALAFLGLTALIARRLRY